MQCLPIAGFLIQPICGIRCKRTRDKQGVLQVTPFVDFGHVWNPRGRAVLEPKTLLSAGLRLRWLYGERWNAGGGWGIPLIDIKLGDRSWQERGLYFSI
ncbi:hypothetical protein [Microcoleus sp. D3_18_C4]|uniref:hypothetical protein n=1 Tax=Microcoleus sp. D3_18_C4 TaxID=3055335 RepID=UPI002FD59CC7